MQNEREKALYSAPKLWFLALKSVTYNSVILFWNWDFLFHR